MTRPQEGSGTGVGSTAPAPSTSTPAPPETTTTTTTTKTLAEVPGLAEWVKSQNQPDLTPTPITRPLGTAGASEVGLGETTFDQDGELALANSTGLGEQTFDNAGPRVDPMSALHMPSLGKLGIKQNPDGSYTTTTTTTTTGGTTSSTTESGWRKTVVDFANKMLGTPYVWGGTSRGGVDCSGLVLLAYQAAGRSMPRISAAQARSGKRVSLDQLRPGDLVAWDNSSRNNGADHIAIYIGGGRIIEAPRPGRNVQVSNIYDKGEAWGVSFG